MPYVKEIIFETEAEKENYGKRIDAEINKLKEADKIALEVIEEPIIEEL
jgi:hypothetical protein